MYFKKYLSTIAIFVFLYGITGTISASKVIPISSTLCKYTIQIPNNWDTIPKEALKEKADKMEFDLGIYQIGQSDYYIGGYSFIGFLPSANSLNNFSVKKMLSFISETNKTYEQNTDTLTAKFDSISIKFQDNSVVIYSYFTLKNDTLSYRNCQILYPTKFGFISMWVYQKGKTMLLDETLLQLENLVQIQDEYKYVEPKGGVFLTHILIALCVGLLVYCAIAFLPKLKKRSEK